MIILLLIISLLAPMERLFFFFMLLALSSSSVQAITMGYTIPSAECHLVRKAADLDKGYALVIPNVTQSECNFLFYHSELLEPVASFDDCVFQAVGKLIQWRERLCNLTAVVCRVDKL